MIVTKKQVIEFNRATENEISESGTISFDLDRRRTRLDTSAVKMLKATKGMFIHFLQIGEGFYVQVNDDNKGYILNMTGQRAGLSINNVKFIRWFFALNKIKGKKASFYMQKAAKGVEWKGQPVYEILHKMQAK